MKQARLNFHGLYEQYKYNVELGFAGEDEVKNQNAALNLLDYSFDVPVTNNSYVRLGQFMIPYGREQLEFAKASDMQFADRSIQMPAFRQGRDVGAAYAAQGEKTGGIFGVFTGGGRDVPERYLPEKLGVPILVARVGVGDVDGDLWDLKQYDRAPGRTKSAFFLNGLYMQDTLIGHSTVLNVKTEDRSILENQNWNPFLVMTPYKKGQLWQGGVDAAVRAPLGSFVLSGEIEGNVAEFSNTYGTLDVSGGRAQVGLFKNPVEVAIQYAVILPDSKFAFYDPVTKKSFGIANGKAIQQITPAITYHMKRPNTKVVFDLPVYVDMPVVTEKGVGSYVVAEQLDQTSAIKIGKVHRQTVVEGRMMLQLGF
jgi:hypothetical protein